MDFLDLLDKRTYTILSIVALILVVDFLWHKLRKNSMPLNKGQKTIQKRKEKNKQKILKLFNKRKEIANDDVQKMLRISHSTATNYLQELTEENKIKQHGETGKWVYYTTFND